MAGPGRAPHAYHAKTLRIDCLQVVTHTDAEEGGWIPTFPGVLNLVVSLQQERVYIDDPEISLVPLYSYHPPSKLSVTTSYPPSQLFNLVYSFPRLHDLSVVTRDMFYPESLCIELINVQSSTPPPFTGTLKLSIGLGLDLINSLLSLPINFRKLDLIGTVSDCSLATALVEKCCDTLESICCQFIGKFISPLYPCQ